jgi:hypothetical protein
LFRRLFNNNFREKTMCNRIFHKLLTIIVVTFLVGLPPVAEAERTINISCKMTYRLKGWSIAYKQYNGFGDVTCNNGQRAHVMLESKSLGLSIGISEIEGTGQFSELRDIKEIYGTFASLEGHAGAAKSADGQVLTRGLVSLALSGVGRGFDIGVTLGGMKISPPKKKR